MQTNSPGAMARSMPSSATTRSGPLPYSLRRWPILIAAPRRSPIGSPLRLRQSSLAAAFELGVRIGGDVGPELCESRIRIARIDQARGREFHSRKAVLDEPVLQVEHARGVDA